MTEIKIPERYANLVNLAIAALEAGEEQPSLATLAERGGASKNMVGHYYRNADGFWEAVDKKLQESGRRLIRQKPLVIEGPKVEDKSSEAKLEKLQKILGAGGPWDDRIEEARSFLFGQCTQCKKAATSDRRLCTSHLYYGG